MTAAEHKIVDMHMRSDTPHRRCVLACWQSVCARAVHICCSTLARLCFFQVRPYTGVRLELGASQTQHASAKRTSAQQPRAASSLRDEIHTEIEHTLS